LKKLFSIKTEIIKERALMPVVNEKKFRLLYVDDEKNSLKAFLRHFRKRPYEILTTSNAAKALSMISTDDFDLVILDISMPGMDGLALLKKLRISHPNLPIIMLSGLISDFVLYQAEDFGCNAFFEKGNDLNFLEKTMEELLKARRRRIA
jgi:CheY-like chemotaxis protein